jgi:ribosome-binding protein aMBF1 (putative translation factor)
MATLAVSEIGVGGCTTLPPSRSARSRYPSSPSTSPIDLEVWMTASTLGRQVRARRQRLGWTLKDLADKTDLSVPYLSDIERGNVNPTLHTLTTLSDALDAPMLSSGCRLLCGCG